MIAFVLIVGEILNERVAQRTLAKENQLIKAFIFDRTDPAFGEGIAIGRLGRKFERFNPCIARYGIEGFGEFGVAIMEQEVGVWQTDCPRRLDSGRFVSTRLDWEKA